METKPDIKELLSCSTQLSKGVLEMKFMKKSKETALKQLQAEESRRIYSEEITEGMKKTGNTVFLETSISNCKGLIEGRLSFLGANPEIEKMMANEFGDKLNEIESNKDKDVTDFEMAKSLSSVTETIQKKFQKKAKRKFMKPSSDI
ncbi:M-phase phosphoprotein 6 [Coccinella septempunctata]|uniref:M-phase phosphoprotein 6 n=1 Tax=Coccinella septempunctata TaxID=41139 RepID=UPI001D067418|nr:M-phase phosphoprotein 6 [Coccinella septempunctata]